MPVHHCLHWAVHGHTWVPQLHVLCIVGYLFSRESYCCVSAQVFWYLAEICEAWISKVVGSPDLALIDDINFSWFILWHAKTMSGELELVLVNHSLILISGVHLPCDTHVRLSCVSQLDWCQVWFISIFLQTCPFVVRAYVRAHGLHL